MSRGQTINIIPALIFVSMTLLTVFALHWWDNRRVDAVLENANKGDVVRVSTGVCKDLRDDKFVEPNTDCGYRSNVEVRLIRVPNKGR